MRNKSRLIFIIIFLFLVHLKDFVEIDRRKVLSLFIYIVFVRHLIFHYLKEKMHSNYSFHRSFTRSNNGNRYEEVKRIWVCVVINIFTPFHYQEFILFVRLVTVILRTSKFISLHELLFLDLHSCKFVSPEIRLQY